MVRLTAALLCALTLSAHAADPKAFKADVKKVVEQGMAPADVSDLKARYEAEGVNDSGIYVAVINMQDFVDLFQTLKAAPAVPSAELKKLEDKLDSIFYEVEIKDPALKAAYLSQIAPMEATRKEVDKRLGEIEGRLAESGKSDAYKAELGEVKQMMAGGDWKGASAKFNGVFDRMKAEGAADDETKGNGNVIARGLKPRAVADKNQFTEYRESLGRGLAMIDVPMPYSEREKSKYDTVSSGEKAMGGLSAVGGATAAGAVAASVGIIDIPITAPVALAGGTAFVLGGFGFLLMRNWKKKVVESAEPTERDPWN